MEIDGSSSSDYKRIRCHEQRFKKRGFKFIGSTICCAFMQATGMVNDHKQTVSDTRLRLDEMCTKYLENLTEMVSFMGIDPFAPRRVVVGFLFEK